MRILMCHPTYFEVAYKINPWMRVGAADNDRAEIQWQELVSLIEACGASVVLIDPVAGLPDMVFTANAGLFIDGAVLVSRFKHPERQEESDYFAEWFSEQGYELLSDDNSSYYFEGAGDALYCGDTLFVGYGFRSDKEYFELLPKLGIQDMQYCELVDPHFYHIDTCFCPLNEETALWWPGAFSETSQAEMRKRRKLIAVSESDAKKFACNAVVIGNKVILPNDCRDTMNDIQKAGFEVHSCDMSEYLKSGGACKCLTLALPD